MHILFVMEILGTVAFACSGALVAIKKQLDLLGILVLGVLTACGGGMMRDILIGRIPPAMFINPVYVAVSGLAVFVIFSLVRFRVIKFESLESEVYDAVMNVFDAVGLGIFTITGINSGIDAGFSDYTFLIVFLGVITGVGGGVLRDIMAGLTPAVLRKHVYACASIAGAVCYVILIPFCKDELNMVISSAVVVIIRLLARHFEWSLPKAF